MQAHNFYQQFFLFFQHRTPLFLCLMCTQYFANSKWFIAPLQFPINAVLWLINVETEMQTIQWSEL